MLKSHTVTIGLIGLTVLSGFLFSSSFISADEVTDEVVIEVPISCTLSGTGMNSHDAEINNGQYNSAIGETTIKASCNDNEGFAVYAIGYTDNEDGKNVLTNASLGSTFDIATGTGTSGANSQWAMKLSTITSPTPTYPITIQNSFDSFHTVPTDYALVAKRTSATDIGLSAEGSAFKTTYQVYISQTQSSGLYSGQVKYTLVHPNYNDAPAKQNEVVVNYDGNGLTFSGGATKNRVVYANSCTPMYIGTNPTIVKSSNIASDGTKNYAYTNSEQVSQVVPFTGADKVRVEIDYGLTAGTAAIDVAEGSWGGWNEGTPPGAYYELYSNSYNLSGTKIYDFDVDTISIYMESWDNPESGYDYGMYARVYPLYDTEEPNTEETSVCAISSTSVSGSYAETTTWNDKWYTIANGELTWFSNQSEVVKYLNDNSASLLGTTLTIYAHNPYSIIYNGNGATAGTMNGFYTTLTTNTSVSIADLMAYNFKKTGYGFAGWSADPNATVNGSSKIYGPNEKIAGNELVFDNNRQATLYAVWVQASNTMQDWSGCSSLNSGQVVALTDNRDSNVYTVGKMQDGNCWMMENLRLDAVNSSDSTKAQGFGGVFTGLANSEDSNFYNSTIANSKYSTSNITGLYIGYRFPRYNNNNTNIGGTNTSNIPLEVSPGYWDGRKRHEIYIEPSDHVQWYGYGNYYTWAAAMANTEFFASSNDSESANTSICPAGWFLPYGNSTGNGATSGGFSYLDIQMGGTGNFASDDYEEGIVSNRWRSYPNNFVYSSSWSFSNGRTGGGFGHYWSQTISTSRNVYTLVFAFDYVDPGSSQEIYNGTEPSYGQPVRCLTDGQ
ncbi:hypothetical protein IJG26_01530 [Candidatus Saccharibacteria bacterium]|nr:hypothetical protein [Candidatus Saccharibacteria bacterium]